MILVWGLVAVAGLILLAFILVFIGFPITFWLSYPLQRFLTFIPINSPKNPTFDDPLSYGIQGAYNFYVTVQDYYDPDTLTKIGAWLILPESDMTNVNSANITDILSKTDKDILFYFHGVLANRAKPINQYGVFRKKFMVIAVDHRGYGDSGTDVEMSEPAIVSDHVQLYKWLRGINQKSNIYYWGHSLGTGISCHTLKKLKAESIVPRGLVLEAPFSTMAEEIHYVLGKFFGWLAYFNATMVKPVGDNGILWQSVSNILDVDCPILIMNAEDDGTIPWTLGQKLYNVAITQRDISKQGNATFVHFPADKGYNHNDVTKDPSVPQLIEDFITTCDNFWSNKT